MDLINKNQLETLLSEIYNSKPVSYSKIRVSGSKRTTYFMHSKSACMPGQKAKFTSNINYKLDQEPVVVGNGFDLENYDLQLGSGGALGWAGRIAPEKGLEDAVAVAAALGDRLLALGGGGP